MMMSGKDR